MTRSSVSSRCSTFPEPNFDGSQPFTNVGELGAQVAETAAQLNTYIGNDSAHTGNPSVRIVDAGVHAGNLHREDGDHRKACANDGQDEGASVAHERTISRDISGTRREHVKLVVGHGRRQPRQEIESPARSRRPAELQRESRPRAGHDEP